MPTFEPEIGRLNYTAFYSNNLSTAINEFLNDVSKFYLAGYKYDALLKHPKLLQANKELVRRFFKNSKKQRFPYLKRFVDYVFTRDEIQNPFSKWFSFDYMEPLRIMMFAKHLASKNNSIQLRALSSFIFLLFQYQNITPFYQILIKRRILQSQKLKQGDKWTKNQERVYQLLLRSNMFSNRVVIISQPDTFYKLVGFANNRHIDIYAEFLGLQFAHQNINAGGFKSNYLIHGIDALKSKYYEFIQEHTDEASGIPANSNEILTSGVIIPENMRNKMLALYNTTLIRDKSRFLFRNHLSGNPFIRITSTADNFTCSLQQKFYDFNFIVASLYLKLGSKQNTLKRFIDNSLDGKIRELILDSSKKVNFVTLGEVLTNLSTNTNPIDTPINLTLNRHQKQIQDSRDVIHQISSTGILIDMNLARQIREEYQKEYSEQQTNLSKNKDQIDDDVNRVNSNIFRDNNDIPRVKNNVYAISINDDIPDANELNDILGKERHLTPEEKINELNVLIEKDIIISPEINGKRRIHGTFTPHGASTGRMTCRAINLQGISKKLRKRLFCAPEGKVLLSADVAGQDITVAANMAMHLYNNAELLEGIDVANLDVLRTKISETLDRLADESSGNEHLPINFITDNIHSAQEPLIQNMEYDDIRSIVKEAVYTMFYGGGKRGFLNSEYELKHIDALLKDLQNATKIIETAFRSEHKIDNINKLFQRIDKSSRRNKIDSIEELLSEFSHTYLPLLSNTWEAEDYKTDLREIQAELNVVDLNYHNREVREIIFNSMEDIVKLNYPGILESFTLYEKYYKINDLTYPSLLNWQTPAVLHYLPKDVVTRSKSYPIQASSAEFIRQWIIELSSYTPARMRKGSYRIVNVIHDQIMVEVDRNMASQMGKHLISMAKKAAQKIGIRQDTLHIPKIEEYPIRGNDAF